MCVGMCSYTLNMQNNYTFLSIYISLACVLAVGGESETVSYKPYSYIVQYSRAFNDERTRPVPSRPAPRPRLVVEEVKRTVEISIQEGYERGGYDHRHYQTLNKTWSEYRNEDDEDDNETRSLPLNNRYINESTPSSEASGRHGNGSKKHSYGEARRDGSLGPPSHFLLPKLVHKNHFFFPISPVTTSTSPPPPPPSPTHTTL